VAPGLERIRDLAVYRHRGDGLQLVLVHGAMDRGAGMLRVARRLRGADIVRYDRRGYGRSRGAAPVQRFSEQVDDLRAVIGGRPSVVFGHSYGGVVAMALASTGTEEIAGVVSYEAPRAWEAWWPDPPPPEVDPSDAAEVFLRRMIGDEVWEALPARTRADRRSEGAAMVAELHEQQRQRYDPASIDVPLVVGVGSSSGERAQRAAQLTASEAPLGELHTIEGAGHGAPITHAGAVADLIRLAHPR
jgi:pimeloyl-ACP methyl ester carboxylesterase